MTLNDEFYNAHCCLCQVSFMLIVVYAKCCLCRLSFKPIVLYADYFAKGCLCRASFMPSIINAKRCLCQVLFMPSVVLPSVIMLSVVASFFSFNNSPIIVEETFQHHPFPLTCPVWKLNTFYFHLSQTA